MPWFRHPLWWHLHQPDPNGPIRVGIQARIDLEIECRPGEWAELRDVRVDSGASYTILNAAWARANGIALPMVTHTLPLLTAAGRRVVRVFDVDLNIRFRRMPEYPFPLAVVISDDYPLTAPPLLGLHNLLNTWRFAFDGTSEPAAMMGHMRFDTL